MVPLNPSFDPWPWRRRVLATAAAAAVLTALVAALVAAPPDDPPGLAADPAGASSSAPGDPPPPSSPDPGDAPASDPPGTAVPSPAGDGPDDDPAAQGGEDDPPPPARITEVHVGTVSWTGCGADADSCEVTAEVSVSTDSAREATLSVLFGGSNGAGRRTFTFRLSGDTSYTLTVPGDQGAYRRTTGCADGAVDIEVSAHGDGVGDTGSIHCAVHR